MPINLKSAADFWGRIFGDSAAPGDGTTSGAPARFDQYNNDIGQASTTVSIDGDLQNVDTAAERLSTAPAANSSGAASTRYTSNFLLRWLTGLNQDILNRLPSELAAGRLSVDGSGVTQPISGTVTGSGGTFPVTDSGGSLTVDAPVGTPVFTRLSDGTNPISATVPLPVRAYTLPSSIATVTFTINNAANLSDTIDIGAGYTLLALIFPATWTAADVIFNCHPTTSGSVARKYTVAGGVYRLAGIQAAAAGNYRLPATDFLGDRFIQLASVAVGALTTVNQGGSRTITGLIGVL
jgi:hypothetical protein